MPRVSVIIPAYNSMKYLPETLSSVLRQTFTDFEVLIIDDGSSDHIESWAKAQIDPRVKFISQANQGVSVARNTGINNAQGEYIAFLDADDLWQPTKLEKQVHCLDVNPEVGLVHTWILLVDEHSQATGNLWASQTQGHVWQELVEHNTIACCSVMARSSCFKQIGGFDASLRSAEDWDMWIRIAAEYPVAVIGEPLAFYRLLSNSKSKNCSLVEKSLSRIIEKSFEFAPSNIQYLKHRSYGYANLNLAWKAIQSVDGDHKQAWKYRTAALKHYPQLRFSKDLIRLSIAITLMQCFGATGYAKILGAIYSVRRSLSGVLQWLRSLGSSDKSNSVNSAKPSNHVGHIKHLNN